MKLIDAERALKLVNDLRNVHGKLAMVREMRRETIGISVTVTGEVPDGGVPGGPFTAGFEIHLTYEEARPGLTLVVAALEGQERELLKALAEIGVEV